MAKTRTPYDELVLIPSLIAERVVMEPYTGEEMSRQVRSQRGIDIIESRRKEMTDEQRRQFVAYCDTRCRQAYQKKATWFELCIMDRGNKGRDQLYVWIAHWLSRFLAIGKGSSGVYWWVRNEFEGRQEIFRYKGDLFYGEITWAFSPHYPDFAREITLRNVRYQACDGHDFFDIFGFPEEECGQRLPAQAAHASLIKFKFHKWLEANGYHRKSEGK